MTLQIKALELMPFAYFINIVDSSLAFTVVIYQIGAFYKCICRIFNDIINYCCYTKCQPACVRVYAIVTIAHAVPLRRSTLGS